MMIIGLTGGIGSGKTTVARIFARLGVPVYEADAASKKLIDTDRRLQEQLKKLLGDEVVVDGKINRPYMASRIFNDEALLEKVNATIHPAVGADFVNWMEQQYFPYVIREAAILFESGSYKDCNKVIVVSAPKDLRIKRVMERNGLTREEVEARMKNQWPESEKLELADYIINNDQTDSIIKQVIDIHEDLIRHAEQGS